MGSVTLFHTQRMGLPEKGWREERKATDLNIAMWDVVTGRGTSKHKLGILAFLFTFSQVAGKLGFPTQWRHWCWTPRKHGQLIPTSLPDSSIHLCFFRPPTCSSDESGYHSLYVPLPHLSLTWRALHTFNSHSNWRPSIHVTSSVKPSLIPPGSFLVQCPAHFCMISL